MADLADTIPGYAEALARERELRELVFCDAVAPICGVDVVPLTLRRLGLLRMARNAFVMGGERIQPAHAAQFLWIVSREFKAEDIAARDRFIRRVAKVNASDLYSGISAYLEMAFFDLEAAGGDGSAPISSFEASVIHAIAKEYGWSREAILDLSLAEISQYLRLIEASRGVPVINPTSDGVKMRWLESLNTRP